MASGSATLDQSLVLSTQAKLLKYRELLKVSDGTESRCPYWDIVVVTGRDEAQKKGYEQQIKMKKERMEIPSFVKYLVFSDPPGTKIGCGGATMYVLEQLQKIVSAEELSRAKVMLIHAGGYSQRLPNLSVLGKIFLTLPCGNPIMQMLDMLLMMFIDLPERMNPGVFLAASDVIFLYNGKGQWDFKAPGFTAVGHPAPLTLAKTHGVFVLEDMKSPWEKYQQDSLQPSMMVRAKCFLHKQTVKKLEEHGAVIPGADLAYVDLAYYMDFSTVNKLAKFYSENKPLTCEIDAYGDFLQALGPGGTIEYCRNTSNVTSMDPDLVKTRESVFHLLKGTDLQVVIFHEAQFNHVGTLEEYLYHMCENRTLIEACKFQSETLVHYSSTNNEEDEEPKFKRIKVAPFDGYVVMHSVIYEKSSVQIGAGSVIEYCIVSKGVQIGKKCVLSNLYIPEYAVVPDEVILHTVAIEMGRKTMYATCALGIDDEVKRTVLREHAMNLLYCGVEMSTALKRIGFDDATASSIWPERTSSAVLTITWGGTQNVECSLWTAKIFPVLSTRKDSCTAAINRIERVKAAQKLHVGSSSQLETVDYLTPCISLADMLKFKSTDLLLAFHEDLRSNIFVKEV